MNRYMNGRILLRGHGGVRRYAHEAASRLHKCTVLTPDAADHPWSARVWEQHNLARSAADGVLLSVAHSGPLRHQRHVVVVHDLLALTRPRSVHPAFARLMHAQLPRLIRRARRVVAVSNAVADEVATTFDLERSSLAVVPPGISSQFCDADRSTARSKLGIDQDRPVVAALLDPTPRKNSGHVAELLRELQGEMPNLHVVVAGAHQPAAFASGLQRRSSHTRRDSFFDLGAATDDQLALMYQAADIFVALSDGEGFGLPVVEAAASGACVVSTPVPSLGEHNPGGAVIVSDASQAHEAIIRLLENEGERHDLTARSKQSLGDLRWEQTAASLDGILTEVATT